MINRNRNSAVARAQAEMKQAVNSSRRSANRLNSSRYTKDKMIKAMEAAGYWYDDIDSQYDNCVVFRTEYGSVSFDNFNKVADWLDGVVFDDPAVAEEVYAILNSNCRVNSSRRQLNCVRDSQDTFASTTEFLNAVDTAINSNPRMGINRRCGEINQLIRIAADSEGCDQSVVKRVDRLFDNFMNATANNTSAASMAENFKKLNDKIQALNSNCSSSRHMSYKTRKAVEYSINCARRRAGYSR